MSLPCSYSSKQRMDLYGSF